MKVTLTNGQEYVFGFRHHYDQTVTVIGDEYWGTIKTKRTPDVTECYLSEFRPGVKHGNLVTVARGLACRNPIDNPNKEVARQVSMDRMLRLVDSPVDRAIIQSAYDNRKKSDKAKVTVDI